MISHASSEDVLSSSPISHSFSEKLSVIEKIMSSGFGAMITSLIVTPFDVVKTRLQAQEKMFANKKCFVYYNGLWDHICHCNDVSNTNLHNNNARNCIWYKRPGHFTGMLDAFVKIVKYEGVTSLWSGLPPTLIMAVPATVLYFTVYDQFRESVCRSLHTSYPPIWLPCIAGACARVLTVTAVSPIELIRTKVQSGNIKYSDISKAVCNMVNQKGILSLWHGWSPTILRDVPFSVIYWSIYESAKKYYIVSEPSVLFSFIIGAGAGSVSAVLTFPFDVAKTYRQIELGETEMFNNIRKTKTIDILVNLYKERGIKVLYTGLIPRLIKVAPSCAIMISSYEYGKTYFIGKKRKEYATLN